MNRYRKLIFVFIFCLAAKLLNAQALQDNSLQQQFVSYQANNYNEKIFIHTDKTFYLTGESIWFKVYCVDETSNKLSMMSKVAYVEIIDKDNKAILQAKISMDSGTGNGSFIIPSFVSSGNYIIRSYTKWMENFDADYFFQTSITIVNNLKPGVAVSSNTTEKKYYINFFPEGGNLVAGLTSKVAFKAVDAFGEPIDCSGTITDVNNNVIANFQSLKFGMGSFDFTPKAGGNYLANVKLNDTVIKVQLPSIYNEGYVMRVENADGDHVNITITSNKPDDLVYLLVHSKNVMKSFQQGRLSSGKIVFTIDKNKLADGISDLTIFNADRQPVCERLYFKQPSTKLNIDIATNKADYETRNQVSVSLKTQNNSNAALSATLSASVFMIDSLQSSNYNDILSYLLLTSELKGNISSPAYYFQNNNDAEAAADNLMLTQGWRRFKWEDVLQNKKPYFEFLPEHEGMLINGKLGGKNNSLPLSKVNVTLTVPGKNFQLSGCQSDNSGNLLFNVRNFYGDNAIILQGDSSYKFEIESPYSNQFSTSSAPIFRMPLQWKDQLLYRSINVQADNSYLVNDKQRRYVYSAEDTSLFYGNPDKRYYLDDYTRFPTMEEVMREYVAEVHVRKDADQFHFRVENFINNTYFEDEPLVLLDGLPVLNTTNIVQFDPLKIKRLDVVAARQYYGNIITDGILSYSTYNGDLGNFPLNASDVIIKFDGLQREREFYSPAYSNNKKEYLPDTRNVLYWSPSIKTGTDGKCDFSFYASDLKGRFACVINGITNDGIAGSNIIFFDVK